MAQKEGYVYVSCWLFSRCQTEHSYHFELEAILLCEVVHLLESQIAQTKLEQSALLSEEPSPLILFGGGLASYELNCQITQYLRLAVGEPENEVRH